MPSFSQIETFTLNRLNKKNPETPGPLQSKRHGPASELSPFFDSRDSLTANQARKGGPSRFRFSESYQNTKAAYQASSEAAWALEHQKAQDAHFNPFKVYVRFQNDFLRESEFIDIFGRLGHLVEGYICDTKRKRGCPYRFGFVRYLESDSAQRLVDLGKFEKYGISFSVKPIIYKDRFNKAGKAHPDYRPSLDHNERPLNQSPTTKKVFPSGTKSRYRRSNQAGAHQESFTYEAISENWNDGNPGREELELKKQWADEYQKEEEHMLCKNYRKKVRTNRRRDQKTKKRAFISESLAEAMYLSRAIASRHEKSTSAVTIFDLAWKSRPKSFSTQKPYPWELSQRLELTSRDAELGEPLDNFSSLVKTEDYQKHYQKISYAN